jgi:hypothetical protein
MLNNNKNKTGRRNCWTKRQKNNKKFSFRFTSSYFLMDKKNLIFLFIKKGFITFIIFVRAVAFSEKKGKKETL